MDFDVKPPSSSVCVSPQTSGVPMASVGESLLQREEVLSRSS